MLVFSIYFYYIIKNKIKIFYFNIKPTIIGKNIDIFK